MMKVLTLLRRELDLVKVPLGGRSCQKGLQIVT